MKVMKPFVAASVASQLAAAVQRHGAVEQLRLLEQARVREGQQ